MYASTGELGMDVMWWWEVVCTLLLVSNESYSPQKYKVVSEVQLVVSNAMLQGPKRD